MHTHIHIHARIHTCVCILLVIKDIKGISCAEENITVSHFLKQNGVKCVTSAPYYTASNSLTERAVKTFKTGMRKMTEIY